VVNRARRGHGRRPQSHDIGGGTAIAITPSTRTDATADDAANEHRSSSPSSAGMTSGRLQDFPLIQNHKTLWFLILTRSTTVRSTPDTL
jgi:hypothetical protein